MIKSILHQVHFAQHRELQALGYGLVSIDTFYLDVAPTWKGGPA